MDWMGAVLVAGICILVFVVAVQYAVIRILAHRKKEFVPSGHFHLKVSPQEWQDGIDKGAFALSISDKSNGKVMFTILVEREDL